MINVVVQTMKMYYFTVPKVRSSGGASSLFTVGPTQH